MYPDAMSSAVSVGSLVRNRNLPSKFASAFTAARSRQRRGFFVAFTAELLTDDVVPATALEVAAVHSRGEPTITRDTVWAIVLPVSSEPEALMHNGSLTRSVKCSGQPPLTRHDSADLPRATATTTATSDERSHRSFASGAWD